MSRPLPCLRRQCVAEALGTFVLVFFGIGSVHAAVLTGAQSGLWQVAVVWGVAISLAIYATGAVSGAHINPAITVALAAFRGFPLRRVPAYVASQLAGAILAAALLFALFGSVLSAFEASHGIIRGRPGSELSAMAYGEYFPNPAIARAAKWPDAAVSEPQAMLAEGVGTALLAMFVFAVTEARNRGGPGGRLGPVFIGLTVSIVISVLAPLTQAGLNPARDFGPRLFAYFAGWGPIAIPGPRGGCLTVYVLAPVLGALAGAGAYQLLLRPALPPDRRLEFIASAHRKATTMRTVRLILVGGFLGAGKTTLLWEAAKRLLGRGRHVGLITNDQAPDLVDTTLLMKQSLDVREVSGSCFCCNFAGLLKAAGDLRGDVGADVLIAEPVGSCTDLSATLLQPLKDKYAQEFALSPLTVLADPHRLREVLAGPCRMDPRAAYILRKQLEEADLIAVSKADLLAPGEAAELRALIEQAFGGTEVRFLSALAGEGVDSWLDAMLAGGPAGRKIAEVDYDTYAEGEAVLGWLNARIELRSPAGPTDWRGFCQQLMESLKGQFARRAAQIGHVKVLLSTAEGSCVGNLTRTGGAVSLRGEAPGTSDRADLIVNARVEMAPEELEALVRQTLTALAGGGVAASVRGLSSFRPGRPHPTHRYVRVV
ncbi:MAG TPA: aquaporin [Phycisphaerae bacterium]|nr:aquaporin [Phycisphaerae bacterium]